ncbi:MAG: signal peptidase II [Gammaproteobacteria bacterium]
MSKVAVVRYSLVLLVAASVIGCDRVTKHVATESLAGEPGRSYLFDTIRLGYAENTGSFLSLGAQLPDFVRFLLFVVAAGSMLVLLLVYALRHRFRGLRLYGVALIVAGGASNLVDRIVAGRVVDFLNVGVGPVRTGIFNVADMALVAGALILALLIYGKPRRAWPKGQE